MFFLQFSLGTGPASFEESVNKYVAEFLTPNGLLLYKKEELLCYSLSGSLISVWNIPLPF